VEVGRTSSRVAKRLQEYILETVDKILDSWLTDWQKLDAINTFALSKVTYRLSTSVVNRTWAAKVDAKVRKRIKKSFRLPARTISTFFHLPCHLGGFGLHSLEDNLESTLILWTLKTLTSKDRLIADIAWDQPRATYRKST